MGQYEFTGACYFARSPEPRKLAEPVGGIFKANNEMCSRFRIFRVHGGENMANGRSCRLQVPYSHAGRP